MSELLTDARQPRRYIAQGEYATGDRPDEVIATVLGSCVAVCLFDPERGAGGMNHILLPDIDGADGRRTLFGAHAMELLINDLLKLGCRKSSLRGKLFGGARMIATLGRAGAMNGEFADRYLASEGIPVESRSIGGTLARRVEFWPSTGRARMRFIEDQSVEVEVQPKSTAGNAVELF